MGPQAVGLAVSVCATRDTVEGSAAGTDPDRSSLRTQPFREFTSSNFLTGRRDSPGTYDVCDLIDRVADWLELSIDVVVCCPGVLAQ
jgi:hypothetical protein